MTQKITILIAVALVLEAHAMLLDSCNKETWIPNGTVNEMVLVGDKLYIGGEFTEVGPNTGCGVPIDCATAAPLRGFPILGGTVRVACADGNGGWFIGGNFIFAQRFNNVGERYRLAHILADGAVDPAWSMGAYPGEVYSICR
jgi:trimeric autotransporter adhesin